MAMSLSINWVETVPIQGFTATVELQNGPNHLIVVEYQDFTGTAAVQFQWSLVGGIEPTATAGPTFTPTNTGLPPIPPGAITATVIRATVLNVRDAPSLGGQVIDRILRGQTYQIVGRNEDATWFLVQLAGKQGWIYGYYTFVDGNEYTPPISSFTSIVSLLSGIQDTGVMMQARATMKLRAEPTTLSVQTGKITWGGFLPVVGRTPDNVWLQVIWKDTLGWVYSPYLRQLSGDMNNVPVVSR